MIEDASDFCQHLSIQTVLKDVAPYSRDGIKEPHGSQGICVEYAFNDVFQITYQVDEVIRYLFNVQSFFTRATNERITTVGLGYLEGTV